MKMSKKWSHFWKIQKHNAGGFTLVELIVVIAILAILAGVAIPAYSGYIEKANRAGDEALLSAVNTAYASACITNGDDINLVNEVKPIKLADGKIPENAVDPYGTEFWQFYGENKDAQFKMIKSLVFDTAKRMFVDPATETNITLSYGGNNVVLSGAQLQILKDSSFYSDGKTSDELLEQVNTVAKIANGMGSIQSVMGTAGYINATMAALGLTSTGDPVKDSQTLIAKAEAIALQKMGLTDKSQIDATNKSEFDKYVSDVQSNALVAITAQKTSGMTAEQAKNLLVGVSSDSIYQNMTAGATDTIKQDAMNQAALAYGMYYAFVNSSACTDSSLKQNQIFADDVTKALDDQNGEFQKYLQSDQGLKDMEAYLAALDVISSGTQTPEAMEKVVTEGFNSEELKNLLNGAMGQ